jgi:hypothetical protein
MSQTFSLVCHATKQTLWIGQGHGGVMSSFYYGEPKTMERLKRFLVATMGKNLVLMENERIANLLDETYTEFEPETW